MSPSFLSHVILRLVQASVRPEQDTFKPPACFHQQTNCKVGQILSIISYLQHFSICVTLCLWFVLQYCVFCLNIA